MPKNKYFPIRSCFVFLNFLFIFLLINPGLWAETLSCDGEVKFTLNNTEASQGSTLLLELRFPNKIAKVAGEWENRDLSFWVSNDGSTYQSLVGIDLDHPIKSTLINVSYVLENGTQLACKLSVRVVGGSYAVERLTVNKKFVQLSEEDFARYKRESKVLKRFWQTVTPTRLWAGKFKMPVKAKRVSGNFGRRRILNGESRSPHSGEDFPADRGTPVYAAQRGQVVMAQDLFFSGNTVVLDHGLGLYTLYAHLNSLNTKRGDLLIRGQILGTVGSTGRVTGPHLHWSVRLNGARVNPMDLMELVSN